MKRFLTVLTIGSLMIVLALGAIACGGSETPETTAPATTAGPATTTGPATTAASTEVTSTEKFQFTYNQFFAPTDVQSILGQWWCDEIERRTNGGITFDYLPGASLSTADKVYDGVVSGITEVGMSCIAYTMGRFPVMELLDYPIGHENGWVTGMVANDLYTKYQPPEFDKVHLLYFHANNLGTLLLANKRVQTLEDMKGLVVRSTGVGALIVNALGGSGLAAPIGEAYELMSKNVVGGSISNLCTLISWNHAEVTKYLLFLGPAIAATDMYVVMNKDAWESLPEDYQKVVTEVSALMPDLHGKGWLYYDKASVDHLLSLPGREVLEIAPEDEPRWAEAMKPLVDKVVSEKKATGLPADDYLAYIQERTAYWASQSPSQDQVMAWYESDIAPLVE